MENISHFQLSTLNFSQLSTLNFDAERYVRDTQADLRPNHLGVGFHDLCFPAARHPACSNRHRESAVLACLWHQTPVSLAINNKIPCYSGKKYIKTHNFAQKLAGIGIFLYLCSGFHNKTCR